MFTTVGRPVGEKVGLTQPPSRARHTGLCHTSDGLNSITPQADSGSSLALPATTTLRDHSEESQEGVWFEEQLVIPLIFSLVTGRSHFFEGRRC